MKRITLIYLLLSLILIDTYSQDTLRCCFNKNWEIVKCNSKKTNTIRIITTKNDQKLKTIYEYTKNGNLKYISHSKASVENLLHKKFKLDGWHYTFDKDDLLKTRRFYKDHKLMSEAVLYSNGVVEDSITLNFIDDVEHKTIIWYYKNGSIERKEKYIKNKLVDSICFDRLGVECEYTPFFEPPSFPGSNKALNKYLASAKYPIEAMKKGKQGRVFVTFTINKHGDPDNTSIAKGVHHILNNAALNHIRKMPKWNPAKKKGENTQSGFMTLPINFVYLGLIEK